MSLQIQGYSDGLWSLTEESEKERFYITVKEGIKNAFDLCAQYNNAARCLSQSCWGVGSLGWGILVHLFCQLSNASSLMVDWPVLHEVWHRQSVVLCVSITSPSFNHCWIYYFCFLFCNTENVPRFSTKRFYIYTVYKKRIPLKISVETGNYRLAASIDQNWFCWTFVPI